MVAKEKDYIDQAAQFTLDTSRSIVVNAVNNLTAEDAAIIFQGGTGAAMQILRVRTSQQLMAAIEPKVESKLNEFGIVKTLNTALGSSNILGSLFGGQNTTTSVTGGISKFASEQMVNGLFSIIQNHEEQNKTTLLNSLKGM
jgi:hypothetical protein